VKGLRGLLLGGTRRDALWLFGSQLVAIVATFVATPIELDRMGEERYGIVVVLSAAVGYVGLLDIGAAWAVMRFVPWHRERQDDAAAQRVVAAAALVSLGVGTAVGAVVFALADPLSSVLDVSSSSEGETVRALRVTAVSVPILLLVSVFSGLGRAVGMFPLVGVVSAGQVVVLNAVWVAVAGTSDDVVKVLVAQLLIGCAAIAITASGIKLRRQWALRPRIPRWETLREITGFGSKTSSGQAGLGLLIAADKPVLGSVIPVASVPFYSIPFALAVRITLVSSSVSSAVFPPAVAALARGDQAEFARLRERAFTVVGLVSGLLAVNCAFGGRPLLDWWLGSGFAEDGWPALAILGVGFGVLACGSIGSVLLDAAGRPGAAAILMLTGGILGLALSGSLAALWDSPVAASAGTATGLAIIGLGGIELARRLSTPVGRTRSFLLVFRAWLPLAAAGLLLRLGGDLAGVPALPSVLLIAAGTAAVALLAYRRSDPGASTRRKNASWSVNSSATS
jgi:O-antigen/teichoic acid export membrane protein